MQIFEMIFTLLLTGHQVLAWDALLSGFADDVFRIFIKTLLSKPMFSELLLEPCFQNCYQDGAVLPKRWREDAQTRSESCLTMPYRVALHNCLTELVYIGFGAW